MGADGHRTTFDEFGSRAEMAGIGDTRGTTPLYTHNKLRKRPGQLKDSAKSGSLHLALDKVRSKFAAQATRWKN